MAQSPPLVPFCSVCLLYLAVSIFYWFPMVCIAKPLWFAYAILFILITIFNLNSY